MRSSKQDIVLALLRQDQGATLDELTAATGWLKHSVRGFLSGTVKTKLKLDLSSEKTERGRTYRIVKGATDLEGEAAQDSEAENAS